MLKDKLFDTIKITGTSPEVEELLSMLAPDYHTYSPLGRVIPANSSDGQRRVRPARLLPRSRCEEQQNKAKHQEEIERLTNLLEIERTKTCGDDNRISGII